MRCRIAFLLFFCLFFFKSIIFVAKQICKPVDMKVFKHSDWVCRINCVFITENSTHPF